MRVDWDLVGAHVLRYSLVGGGVTSLVVYGAALWVSYPVELAALLVSMLAVAGLVALFRDDGSAGVGVGRSGSLFGTGGIGTGDGGSDRPPSRDRIAIYYLAGLLAFAGLVVVASLILG